MSVPGLIQILLPLFALEFILDDVLIKIDVLVLGELAHDFLNTPFHHSEVLF